MMPKENLIKFIIGRLGFEIVGKKDPIEEILDNGIDREVTLDKEGRNILSYEYFIETSTE
jgi:beta-xylosidase